MFSCTELKLVEASVVHSSHVVYEQENTKKTLFNQTGRQELGLCPTSAILQKLSFSQNPNLTQRHFYGISCFSKSSVAPLYISHEGVLHSLDKTDINQLFRSSIMNVMTPNVESIVWFLVSFNQPVCKIDNDTYNTNLFTLSRGPNSQSSCECY